MCLLIFAHRVAARYPLLVAANRDEFHARPTSAAQFWEQYPHLLAGRDDEQGPCSRALPPSPIIATRRAPHRPHGPAENCR